MIAVLRFVVRVRVRLGGTRSVHWTEQGVRRILHHHFDIARMHYLRKNTELRRMR